MRQARSSIPVLAVTLVTLLSQAVAAGPKPERRKLKLTTVRLRKGSLRPGTGMTLERAPKKALRAVFGEWALLFVDGNGDGRLGEPGRDGLALEGYPFIVPMPKRLLLPDGQFRFAFKGRSLLLEADKLALPDELVRAAAVVTELRIRSGLVPLILDESGSKACREHCDYLKINHAEGMGLHDEDPAKSGYTAEGAAAGKGSCILPVATSYGRALRGWFATPWHGAPMVDPSLRTFGASLAHGFALFYPLDRVAISTPFVHPADGATGVPREFNRRGEIPNPVPGTTYAQGCGFRIFVMLPAALNAKPRPEVTVRAMVPGRKGRLKPGAEVEGTISCPSAPANPTWPTNSGLALFIPAKPLAAKTTYRVEFRIQGIKPLVWTFTTAE